MADLTIAAALRLEARAARRGAAAARVVAVGMRARRAGALAGAAGPVAVLGVAAGVAPWAQPGDVVVATEVRDGAGAVVRRCDSAVLLAGALRRAGLRVHTGPVVTLDRLARPRELTALATTGAVAADMESAHVARVVPGAFAVVRVVTDTVAAPLLRPSVVRTGRAALATLTRAVPVVEQWARAVRPGEVELASPRSFCAGVERAIDIVERALDRYGAPVYVRRQIVHNAHIVASLERRGAVFVEELAEVPDGARVIFAAHGVAPEVRAEADRRSLSVIDATCPLVAKVHAEVRRYAGAGHDVFLIGHADHEEVVGTFGEAPDHVLVVEDVAAARTVDVADPSRVAYVMQTTLAVDEAEQIAGALRDRFPTLVAPRSDDICYATSNRQAAVREIARDCDLVLVVGSANSSNSQRLVEVARRSGAAAHLVDSAGDVDLDWLAGAPRVGVTAGASAPPHLVDELVAALRELGRSTVRETTTVTENLTFTLPREVS